jgi:hypothetical protein
MTTRIPERQGSHRSNIETVVMTPAAKAHVSAMVAGVGNEGKHAVKMPPIHVALPARKERNTGYQTSL